MAAPSKSFTVITDARIDADSPWTEDVTTDLRDNDIHLEEWLGKNYTAAVDHDHDTVNSKAVTLGAATVAQAELKTSTGQFNSSIPGLSSQTTQLDNYAHIPDVGSSNNSDVWWGWEVPSGGVGVNTSGQTLRALAVNNNAAARTGHLERILHAA